MNFDGASKGNPGPAGFRVVFRDKNGKITHILVGILGQDTNNSIEVWLLLRGIQLATQIGYKQLIVEGDSKITIFLFTKLLYGSDPEKIYPSWQLLSTLELFKYFLTLTMIIIASHFRREAIKTVDKLVNIGVSNGWKDICI